MTALISPRDVRPDSWETFPKALIYMLFVSFSVVSTSLKPYGLWPTRHLCPWNSPGKNTEVGSHSLLQGIFLTQGWNQGLLHRRRVLYCLSPGSPASQAGSLPSEPGVPWIAGGFFTVWARGLLPRRRVLYRLSPRKALSHQGSPKSPRC